jgi:hypothetical protein
MGNVISLALVQQFDGSAGIIQFYIQPLAAGYAEEEGVSGEDCGTLDGDYFLFEPIPFSLPGFAAGGCGAGTWGNPRPGTITAALLSRVTAMNLTSAAASLTDQIAGLELVENLPGKSLACLDLKAIQANVASLLKHGTINQTQANTINPWVVPVPGYIATSLGCH